MLASLRLTSFEFGAWAGQQKRPPKKNKKWQTPDAGPTWLASKDRHVTLVISSVWFCGERHSRPLTDTGAMGKSRQTRSGGHG